LKAVYRNIRAGFDNNLTDYLHPSSIVHRNASGPDLLAV
jgi:hypothetical protein